MIDAKWSTKSNIFMSVPLEGHKCKLWPQGGARCAMSLLKSKAFIPLAVEAFKDL